MKYLIIEEDIKNIVGEIEKEALQLSGKTILISGGEGFIGSFILQTIAFLNEGVLKKPCRVISVDNYITGRKKRLGRGIEDRAFTFLEKDVSKAFDIEGKVDYIVHAAGLASPFYYKKYPIETIESAIFGAKNLLEIAREKKVESFLYFSSSEIYGDPAADFIPTPETYRGNVSSVGPRACYDESKRLGETLCMVYYSLYKVPVRIVRPFNIYGPGMLRDDYRVIPSFIGRALDGKPLFVHDNGAQTRTFCYVSDAIAGFFKVLLSGANGEVFNVGNDDREISILELAGIVSRLFEEKIKVETISYPKSYPKDEPRRRCPDLTKIKTQLSYSPRVTLDRGLARMLQWAR